MDTQATVAAAAALHDVAGADRKAIGEMIGEPTRDELLPFGTKQAMSVPGIGSGNDASAVSQHEAGPRNSKRRAASGAMRWRLSSVLPLAA